jgi:predicted XRE-type DNA-binding protein
MARAERIERLRAALPESRKQLERARADRDRLIRDARRAGMSTREIAPLVGLSQPRVVQLIKDESS